jgi:LysR family hydrogen peroxide-inducible transcriptional activator
MATETAISPTALTEHKVLLMGEGHCFRDQVLEACPGLQESILAHNARDHAIVEGSSLDTLKHMVASGMGITVLPESAASTALYGEQELVVRPFVDPSPFRTIALAWRVSYPRHQAIDVLAEALKD